jgi:transketolase
MPQSKSLKYCETDEVANIQIIATKLREEVIEMLLEAKSGHSAGAIGMAEIYASLYFHIANITPENAEDPNRDKIVVSNGHTCPILYAALAYKGFFGKHKLKTLRKLGSPLQGHQSNVALPGVENSGGPLAQGLSIAIGMALASRLEQKTNRIYCLGSDGELNEGQIWEAAMFAGNKRVNNLTWIIDRNNIQIDGYTEDIMPLEPLREKLEAFNWYVLEIDGHNIEEIINSCNMAKAVASRPTVIIAHTIPGKDIPFMEYKFEWHGKPPNKEQAREALKKLRTLEGKIRCHDYD